MPLPCNRSLYIRSVSEKVMFGHEAGGILFKLHDKLGRIHSCVHEAMGAVFSLLGENKHEAKRSFIVDCQNFGQGIRLF